MILGKVKSTGKGDVELGFCCFKKDDVDHGGG